MQRKGEKSIPISSTVPFDLLPVEEEILYLLLEGIALVFVVRERCWNIPLPPNPAVLITFPSWRTCGAQKGSPNVQGKGAGVILLCWDGQGTAFPQQMKFPAFLRFQSLFWHLAGVIQCGFLACKLKRASLCRAEGLPWSSSPSKSSHLSHLCELCCCRE